jgi:two-component system sensor kinase FixL
MTEFLRNLFSSDFMGHGFCYRWNPEIVWLHAVSDGLITLAYAFIPLALVYFVRKRRDLPFHWIFFMFGVFIFGCGTTHAMEIWTLWHGTYRLAGVIKAITAAASLATAAAFVPLIPRALALPSPTQLRQVNLDLTAARAELEDKVQQRTAELARVNEQLRAEIVVRSRAEEALQKQASLLELAHDAIIVRDMNDGITYWNSGAEEIYGWQRQDAIGKIAHIFLSSVYPAEMEVLKAKVVDEGRWEGELIQSRRDGTKIVVSSRWALQRDDNGNPAAILQINTDVTERKRSEETLQTAQAQLAHMARVTTMGELAASIAHEVNQPLAAVVSNANACIRWLAAAVPNPDEARAAATRIVKEGSRASDVIGRIRSLMKKSSPQRSSLDMNALIGETLTLTHHQILKHGILLRTELEAGLPAIQGDPVQLQQVILNLILNAIEATSAQSVGPWELRLSSQSHGPDEIVIAIRDSGMGIDPGNIDQLFKPFFTTKAAGMGMGLSISRSAIESHGGRLWATPNEGPGTTFQFSLPAFGVA